MKKSRRWLTSAIAEASKMDAQMPRTRGPQAAQYKPNAARTAEHAAPFKNLVRLSA